MKDIVVVDYGAGNLLSVVRAVKASGAKPTVTSDPTVVTTAKALIVPGVGAAADTMWNLRTRGLDRAILEFIESDRPFLGGGMGMQALFEMSREGGTHECLGVLQGEIVRFPEEAIVPHMGWNVINQVSEHPIMAGIETGFHFYFVHSYFAKPTESDCVIAEASYAGIDFPAVVGKGNLMATQFHPEKSGPAGLRLYNNFIGLLD
ncbi:MAG TPA: imidazole glycerol phosphate synthase subunit HisH [Dehalococcoidia bacterium]|nr:imidazole glycerol phosphate synthase subunit HisH [Dehalococcoidia bacterium]